MSGIACHAAPLLHFASSSGARKPSPEFVMPDGIFSARPSSPAEAQLPVQAMLLLLLLMMMMMMMMVAMVVVVVMVVMVMVILCFDDVMSP